MKFITANSTVPVPRGFVAFTEDETKMNFIVMEFIPSHAQPAKK